MAFAALLAISLNVASNVDRADAQQPRTNTRPQSGTPSRNVPPKQAVQTPPAPIVNSKLSESEKKAERARELFADAANAQNNGAYDLAIENWEKMLKEFPKDALASSARHFLGICYLQKGEPDFPKAIVEFKLALQDSELKQREEAMINLGWSLYQKHFVEGAKETSKDLGEAVKVLRVAIERYPDGSFLDKALFYVAEAEARLGQHKDAIEHYRLLIQNKRLEGSTVRPDAIFGIGLTYEEMNQPILALEYYDTFLTNYKDHPLANDVRLRAADLTLAQGDAAKAAGLFQALIKTPAFGEMKNGDYVLYRYGFSLAKDGKFQESAEVYKTLAERFPNSSYSKNSSLAAGQALMREKKYDAAIAAFEPLVALRDERGAEAAHWISQIHMIQGKYSDVIPLVKDVLTWGNRSPSATLLKMDLADSLNTIPASRAEAKGLYEEIATENPDDPIAPRATYNAAFSALQLGALADAQRWSEAFAKRYPSDPLAADIAYIRAESTLQLGQYESASNAFEQLLASQSDDPMRSTWENRLTVAHYLAGNWDKAIAVADRLLKSKPEPEMGAEVLYMKGASQLKLGKTVDAVGTLEESLRSSPTWHQAGEVSITLAEAYGGLKKAGKGIETLEALLKRDPQSRLRPQAEFRIGQFAAGLGEYDRAIQAYDAVLASTQDQNLRDYASYGKAFALIQGEKFGEALPLLEPIGLDTRNDSLGIESRMAKGICLRQLNRAEEAAKTLALLSGESLPLETKVKVLYERSLSLIAAGKHDEAIAVLNELSKHSDAPEALSLQDKALYELAWAHKSKGDNVKAIQLFEQLVSKYPESGFAAEAYFHMGQAQYDSSQFDKAIKALQVAAAKSVDTKLQEQSMYRLGWAHFQQGDFPTAIKNFRDQIKEFPNGPLLIDGKFMVAECLLKEANYSEAFSEYKGLRDQIKKAISRGEPVGDQVQTLTLLHGGQAARELKQWKDAETWTAELISRFPQSQFRPIALYELAYAKQNSRKHAEAINHYTEVADNYRNELGARSRFMIGELLFAERDFAKAIAEFQKVMYGYGATQAPEEIKNWQARSAFEAGRCSEILIADLTGERKQKAIDTALKFYEFVTQNHEQHELAQKAKDRIVELRR